MHLHLGVELRTPECTHRTLLQLLAASTKTDKTVALTVAKF